MKAPDDGPKVVGFLLGPRGSGFSFHRVECYGNEPTYLIGPIDSYWGVCHITTLHKDISKTASPYAHVMPASA
jgi:hypothetical protein